MFNKNIVMNLELNCGQALCHGRCHELMRLISDLCVCVLLCELEYTGMCQGHRCYGTDGLLQSQLETVLWFDCLKKIVGCITPQSIACGLLLLMFRDVSVCLSITTVSYAESAEPIQMLFLSKLRWAQRTMY